MGSGLNTDENEVIFVRQGKERGGTRDDESRRGSAKKGIIKLNGGEEELLEAEEQQ